MEFNETTSKGKSGEQAARRHHFSVTVGPQAPLVTGRGSRSSGQPDRRRRPGWLELFGSLGRTSQLFLLAAVLYAILGTTLAAVSVGKAGKDHLQDALLVLFSSLFFLFLALHALFQESAYELLICMGLTLLNGSQLIVFGVTLGKSGDTSGVGLVVVCVLLQAAAAVLGRYAWATFGWRLYSRLECDLRRKDAEQCRKALCQMDLFGALAKLDGQLLVLWFLVSISNGINPSGSSSIPVLIGAAAAGLPIAGAWLLAAQLAVRRQQPSWALGVEFSMPLCYVMPLLVIYAGVAKRDYLGQSHGMAYLVMYSLLLLCIHTAVWWDLRLLSRDFATLRKARSRMSGGSAGGGAGTIPALPQDVLPLVHGAWLRKLPSGGTGGCGPKAGGGRWRFFQLSHDGSTLRWAWHKFVLLYHVEDIICNDEELTITLSLLLDPDLRLQFPDMQLYTAWQQGLRLLLRLLLDPQGLQAVRRRGDLTAQSSCARDLVLQLGGEGSMSVSSNSSPARLLKRLRAGSQRACVTELTREQMELAAQHARSMLSPKAHAEHCAAAGDQEEEEEGEEGRAENKQLSPSGDSGGCSSESEGRLDSAESAHNGAIPAHKRAFTQPSPNRRAKAKLDWVRRAITLPSHLLRCNSVGTASSEGSPSRQRLALHQSSSSDGSDAEEEEEGEGAQEPQQRSGLKYGKLGDVGDEGSGSSHPRWRRFKSRSMDADRATAHSTFTTSGSLPQPGGEAAAAALRVSPFDTSKQEQDREVAAAATVAGAPDLATALSLVPGNPAAAAPDSSSSGGSGSLPSLRAYQLHAASAGVLLSMQQQPEQPPGLEAAAANHLELVEGAAPDHSLVQLYVNPLGPFLDHPAAGFESGLAGQQEFGQQLHRIAEEGSGSGGGGGTGSGPGQERAAHVQHRHEVSISLTGVPAQGWDGPQSPRERKDSGGGFVFLTGANSGGAGAPSRLGAAELQYPSPTPSPAQPEQQHQQTSQQSGPGTEPNMMPARPPPPPPASVAAAVAAVAAAAAAASPADVGGGYSTTSSQQPSPRAGSGQAEAQLGPVNTPVQPLGLAGRARASSPTHLPVLGGRANPYRSAGLGSFSALGGTFRSGSMQLQASGPSLELLPAGSGLSGSLWRGDSDTLSSWGLGTPTSARIPVGGLSRFNSWGGMPPRMQQHHSGGSSPNNIPEHAPQAAAGAGGQPMMWAAGGLSSLLPPGMPYGRHSASAQTTSSNEYSLDRSLASIPRSLGVNVPLIDYEDLMFGKLLGEGSEGSVYAAWYLETPVAVKKTSSLAEVEISLHAGSHDNIVGVRGICQHENFLYLVMELCPRGTLDVLIHHTSSHRLEPLKLLPIVRSVARGMLHLHSRKPAILHRDLKPANLFIGHGYMIKIGDFGMSRYAAPVRGTGGSKASLARTLTPGVIGTAAYCAPEVLSPESPSAEEGCDELELLLKADVYSFGVTLWEVMERKRPFGGMDGFQIQTQWFLEPESMRLPPVTIPDNLTPQGRQVMQVLAGLVQSCTLWEVARRPSFKEILGVLRSATGGESVPQTPAASPVRSEAPT